MIVLMMANVIVRVDCGQVSVVIDCEVNMSVIELCRSLCLCQIDCEVNMSVIELCRSLCLCQIDCEVNTSKLQLFVVVYDGEYVVAVAIESSSLICESM